MNTYDPQRTWQWNLQHAPALFQAARLPPASGKWSWCGLPVASPLGISAGPLLNSDWLLHYANFGFDILVYKTVRSRQRDCYTLPNLIPVSGGQLTERGTLVQASADMNGSWAVSFGMPSQDPEAWQKDVTRAREHLAPGKLLVVSVVGTQYESQPPGPASLEQLAADFAQCAKWAVESGAHGIEANFSCPNVNTADGQLFQQPQAAGLVAERIRASIGTTPLVLKIGRVTTADEAAALLQQVGPHISGLAMTNSIAARVADVDGSLFFDGQPRGICGDAIRAASVAQVRMFREQLQLQPFALDIIGVGGISTVEHVHDYLNAGAASVGIATAAMINPAIGVRIRDQLHGIEE